MLLVILKINALTFTPYEHIFVETADSTSEATADVM